MKFQLYYPVKPFITTQGWGIKNDSYLQFGFSRHNGHDFLLESDAELHAPCDFKVYEIGEIPSGAGKYIKGITGEVEAEGTTCYANLMFMHLKEQLVKAGDEVKVGQVIAYADNTGFSTGPHTHLSVWRTDVAGTRLDTSPEQLEANRTFNPLPYFNGYFAEDYSKVVIIKKLLELYKQCLQILKLR